jgi:hypothetical protein
MLYNVFYEQLIAIALEKSWHPVLDPRFSQADFQQLASFVGKYEIDPGCFLTMSIENDRLYLQETNLPKFELLPLSSDAAFVKDSNTRFQFRQKEKESRVEVIATNPSLQWIGRRVA